MSLFTINGSAPDVLVLSLRREASILDGENAGRLKNGNMVRDLIGTYYNYALEAVSKPDNLAAYDSLYQTITAPVESYPISVPFGQGILEFDAYIANATDELRRMRSDRNIWKGLAFAVTAMEPQRYWGESWSIGQGSGNQVFTLDGIGFNVPAVKLERKGSVLDTDQSKRSTSGVMSREIIGTFYNYTLSLVQDLKSVAEYDRLYYALTAPVDSHLLTVPYGQSTLTFQAYVSRANDQLLLSNDKLNRWGNLEVDFIAMTPARR